jgi:hypothetical protein
MMLRERAPVAHFALLLGPRVGLRMRRPIMAALCAPFAWETTLRASLQAAAARGWARTGHAAFVERTAGASAERLS